MTWPEWVPKEGSLQAERFETLWRHPESLSYRKQTSRWFHTLFPRGHRESLRPLAQLMDERAHGIKIGLSEEAGAYYDDKLSHIHPDAFSFLLKHGIDYKPLHWKERPQEEPVYKACYSNAWKAVNSDPKKIMYVEGLVWGVYVSPALHGWNTFDDAAHRASDWTFYAHSIWCRYLGFPLTKDEVLAVYDIRAKDPASMEGPSLLFSTPAFTKPVQAFLAEVISKRSKKNS